MVARKTQQATMLVEKTKAFVYNKKMFQQAKYTNFRKILLLSIITIYSVSVISAKSKNKNTESFPLWITEEGKNSLFPKDEYLSASAFGSSGSEAKSKAAAEISENIKTIIKTNLSSEYFATEENGNINSNKIIQQNIMSSSANTIYQLEYTTPYYYSDYGMYICIAYINRKKAFDAVQPKLDKIQQIFPTAYKNAISLNDNLKEIIAIQKAQKILNGFYEVYDFAIAVAPEKAKSYSELDILATESFSKLDELKSEVKVYINVIGDINNQIYDKISDCLSRENFSITNSNDSNYEAKATVNIKITKNPSTYQAIPSITIDFFSDNNAIYSYSKQLDKVSGFDEDTVYRRSYMNLCNAIENDFLK